MRGSRILLVEGADDKDFYSACLRTLKIGGVEVGPPSTYGMPANGRGNAISLLPLLLRQMEDGTLEKLGLTLDADYKHNGVGHTQAYRAIVEILEGFGYTIPSPYPKGRCRYIFEHPDGLPPFGLWVMPDSNSDGMVEDLIASAIKDGEQRTLFQHAQKAVEQIKAPRFDTKTHKAKAIIYTWLAWQKMPGKRLVSTIGDELVTFNNPPAAEFASWLLKVFK